MVEICLALGGHLYSMVLNGGQGLGLSEEDIKSLFGYFDIDGSGEIDFSEFRRFLQGGIDQTGLAVWI